METAAPMCYTVGMNTNREFFISGYVMPPRTSAAFGDIRACGLNHIYIDYTTNDAVREEALSLCDETDLGAIVMTAWGRDDDPSFARVTKGAAAHKSFAGVNGLDEPLYEEIDGIRKEYEGFAQAFPDKTFYVNMVNRGVPPEFVSKNAGVTHKDLMTRYARLVRDMPRGRTVSMTVYPLMHNGGRPFLNENHLLSLSDLAECAQTCGADMYFFVQAMPFRNTHRKPDITDLRFQVNCGLAFGARGIQYFCYRTPDPNREFSADQHALVLKDGTKTDTWFAAQTVNAELQALADRYLPLTYTDTFGIRGRRPEQGEKAFDRFYTDKGLPEGMTACRPARDLLVGAFKDGADNAYYLTGYAEPSSGRDNYIEFALDGRDECFITLRGVSRRVTAVNGRFCVLLAAGDGALVTVR